MKFGVTFPQTELGNDPIAIRDFAQTIEGLGFESFLAYDHVLSADSSVRPNWGTKPYDLRHPFHEVFVLFGFIAAVTERIELVTGVLILPQRQTALVAKQAAEVDVLSGGRMRLGVGVGWNDVEYGGLGKDFRNRGARCEEQIDLLRALWTSQSITFEGRWESIHDAGIVPMPIQRPIPIWIGGYVEETLKRVGRMGDGWFPRGAPDDEMKASIERMRDYAEAVGRDPNSIGIDAQLSVGSGTPGEWRAVAEGWKGLGANYLTVNTMRSGFTTPKEHLAAIERAAQVLLP